MAARARGLICLVLTDAMWRFINCGKTSKNGVDMGLFPHPLFWWSHPSLYLFEVAINIFTVLKL